MKKKKKLNDEDDRRVALTSAGHDELVYPSYNDKQCIHNVWIITF